ncbi:MAG: hypothetical protein K8S87_03120, partial [Planctomycetes bacterium]|nr:hypothetical protein [Planctomycetota bacterium]
MKSKKYTSKLTLYDKLELDKFQHEQDLLPEKERKKRNNNNVSYFIRVKNSVKNDSIGKKSKQNITNHIYNNIVSAKYIGSAAILLIIVSLVFYFYIVSDKNTDFDGFVNASLDRLLIIKGKLYSNSVYNESEVKDAKSEITEITQELIDKKYIHHQNLHVNKLKREIVEINETMMNYELEYFKKKISSFENFTNNNENYQEQTSINKKLSQGFEYYDKITNMGLPIDLFDYTIFAFDFNNNIDNKDAAKEWFVKIVTQNINNIDTARKAIKMGKWFIKDLAFEDAAIVFKYLLSAYESFEEIKAHSQLYLAYSLFNLGPDVDFADNVEFIINNPNNLDINDDTSNRIKGFNLLLKFCDHDGKLNRYALKHLD